MDTSLEDIDEEIKLKLGDAVLEKIGRGYVLPVEILPYNGREGGYQYITGAPLTSFDLVLETQPFELSDEVVNAIADTLDNISDEWVPDLKQEPDLPM